MGASHKRARRDQGDAQYVEKLEDTYRHFKKKHLCVPTRSRNEGTSISRKDDASHNLNSLKGVL